MVHTHMYPSLLCIPIHIYFLKVINEFAPNLVYSMASTKRNGDYHTKHRLLSFLSYRYFNLASYFMI